MNQYAIPLIWAAMFAVMYFFFIRPQSQKVKKEKDFTEGIQKGDKIVTTGGIHATVDKLEESSIILEIDKNVKIRMERSGVSMDMTLSNYPKEGKKS